MDSWEIFEINDFTDSSEFEKFISLLGKYFKEWALEMEEYKIFYFLENPESEWLKREQILNYGQDRFMLSLFMLRDNLHETNSSHEVSFADSRHIFASKTHHLKRWFGCSQFVILKRLLNKSTNPLDTLRTELYPQDPFQDGLKSDAPLSSSQTYTLLSALSLALQLNTPSRDRTQESSAEPGEVEPVPSFAGTPLFVCIHDGAKVYEGLSLGPKIGHLLTSRDPQDSDADTRVWYRVNYRMLYFTQPFSGLAYYDYLLDLFDDKSSVQQKVFGPKDQNKNSGKDARKDSLYPGIVSVCFTLMLCPSRPYVRSHWTMPRFESANPGASRQGLSLHDATWALGTELHPLKELFVAAQWLNLPTLNFPKNSEPTRNLPEPASYLLRENEGSGCNVGSYHRDVLSSQSADRGAELPRTPSYVCSLRGNPAHPSEEECLLTSKMFKLLRLVTHYEATCLADPQEPFLDPGDYMKGDTLESIFPPTLKPTEREDDLHKVLDRMIKKAASKGTKKYDILPGTKEPCTSDGGPNPKAIPDALMDAIFLFLFPDSQSSPPEHKVSEVLTLTDPVINDTTLDKKLKLGPAGGLGDRMSHVLFFLTNRTAAEIDSWPGLEDVITGFTNQRSGIDQDSTICARLKEFWKEFVLELRYRWDRSIPLPLVDGGKPDFHYDLVYQKFQMLNSCIALKGNRGPSPALSPTGWEGSDDEQFYECRQSPTPEAARVNSPVSGSKSPVPEGRDLAFGKDLKLFNGSDILYIPVTQEPPFMTEDQMELYVKVLTETADRDVDGGGTRLRAELQSSTLKSDMQAFKAANPTSGDIRDFLRWYSPADLVWQETAVDDASPTCSLSPRMLNNPLAARKNQKQNDPGVETTPDHQNIWIKLWERETPALPVSRQKRLFDEVREGEKVLHYLAHLSLRQLTSVVLIPYLGSYACKVLTQLLKRDQVSENCCSQELKAIAQKFLNSLSHWISTSPAHRESPCPDMDSLHVFQTRVLPHLMDFESVWSKVVFSQRFINRYFSRYPGEETTLLVTNLLNSKQIDVRLNGDDCCLLQEIRATGCDFLGPSNLKLLVEPSVMLDRNRGGNDLDPKFPKVFDDSLKIGLITKEYVITRDLSCRDSNAPPGRHTSHSNFVPTQHTQEQHTTLHLYALVGKSEFRVTKTEI